jgi:hypothetical protein
MKGLLPNGTILHIDCWLIKKSWNRKQFNENCQLRWNQLLFQGSFN